MKIKVDVREAAALVADVFRWAAQNEETVRDAVDAFYDGVSWGAVAGDMGEKAAAVDVAAEGSKPWIFDDGANPPLTAWKRTRASLVGRSVVGPDGRVGRVVGTDADGWVSVEFEGGHVQRFGAAELQFHEPPATAEEGGSA